MQAQVSTFMVLYHALLVQVRAAYEQDDTFMLEDLPSLYHQMKPYKKLRRIAAAEDVQLVENFLKHDVEALIHNRAQSVWEQSPSLLMLKDMLWDVLYQGADLTQLHWYEMHHDVAQHGQYRKGEYVVHGWVECDHCGLIRSYVHLHELTCCERCCHEVFVRPRHFPRKIDPKSHHRY